MRCQLAFAVDDLAGCSPMCHWPRRRDAPVAHAMHMVRSRHSSYRMRAYYIQSVRSAGRRLLIWLAHGRRCCRTTAGNCIVRDAVRFRGAPSRTGHPYYDIWKEKYNDHHYYDYMTVTMLCSGLQISYHCGCLYCTL